MRPEFKPAARPAVGGSGGSGGSGGGDGAATDGDSKKKAKKPKQQSSDISLKMFLADAVGRRLAADVVGEFRLKLPRGAKPFVVREPQRGGSSGSTIAIVDAATPHDGQNNKMLTTTHERPGSSSAFGGGGGGGGGGAGGGGGGGNPLGLSQPGNEAQIQGAIFQLFDRKPAWTAKELANALHLNAAQIKKHLKAIDAYYHQSGELASMWTRDKKYEKIAKKKY
jgi:hypothetical protein